MTSLNVNDEPLLLGRDGVSSFERGGLITVFDAILTGRHCRQKLQCFYGNPMANNFFQN